MSTQVGMQGDVVKRDDAMGQGGHDHWLHAEETRRLQADAIATVVRWAWTNGGRMVERLIKKRGHVHMPTARGEPIAMISGSTTVAAPSRRGVLRLARRVRRSILEPQARRRRIAIAQLRALDDHLLADIGLTRGQVELAVDGMLARRDDGFVRPAGRSLPTEELQHELPPAA